MNVYQKYRPAESAAGWTRIDILLVLFDGALDRLGRVESLRAAGDAAGVREQLARVQIILGHLIGGVLGRGQGESPALYALLDGGGTLLRGHGRALGGLGEVDADAAIGLGLPVLGVVAAGEADGAEAQDGGEPICTNAGQ